MERTLAHGFFAIAQGDRMLSASRAEFQSASEPDTHAHPGAEFLHILSGSLELTLGRQVHQLDEGDSICFDPSVPHAYRRRGEMRCTAIVVTTS